MKKTVAFILVLMLVVALCGCSAKKDEPAATEAPATEAPDFSGEYKAFGMKSSDMGDYIVDTTGVLDMSFTLNADGTGAATNAGDTIAFTWTASGDTVSLTAKDSQTMDGTIKDGVMMLTNKANSAEVTVYLAKEGADTSSYDVKKLEDVLKQAASEQAQK